MKWLHILDSIIRKEGGIFGFCMPNLITGLFLWEVVREKYHVVRRSISTTISLWS